MDINILLPVLNEELSLENGVIRTLSYVNKNLNNHNVLLTIVDNGSTDSTQKISTKLIEEYSNVKYLRLEKRGVGLAFREGVKKNEFEIVGYMDIDLSTDLKHINEVISALEEDSKIDIINGSRLNKESIMANRKWYRKITSIGLVSLLKIFFNMKASDAICGFKFFRKETVENLIIESNENDDGWFFIIELIIRAEKKNINIKSIFILKK
jgi:glycosyltransferase involved in cell wall biosynthesis